MSNITINVTITDPDNIVRAAVNRMRVDHIPPAPATIASDRRAGGPVSAAVDKAIEQLIEVITREGCAAPAEIRIVDRHAKHTVSYTIGASGVTVVVGQPAPRPPDHMRVVTRWPCGSTHGPVEIVAVCETEGAAWALVDEIAAERTGSGRHPLWGCRATSYPVRR